MVTCPCPAKGLLQLILARRLGRDPEEDKGNTEVYYLQVGDPQGFFSYQEFPSPFRYFISLSLLRSSPTRLVNVRSRFFHPLQSSSLGITPCLIPPPPTNLHLPPIILPQEIISCLPLSLRSRMNEFFKAVNIVINQLIRYWRLNKILLHIVF